MCGYPPSANHISELAMCMPKPVGMYIASLLIKAACWMCLFLLTLFP